jgi:hypothetical protein
MTKVTYICRSAKKKVVTYFIFIFIFIFYRFFRGAFRAFRNKGSSKTRKQKIEKTHLGSSEKKAAFFSSFLHFFSPSVVLFDFFIECLGVS